MCGPPVTDLLRNPYINPVTHEVFMRHVHYLLPPETFKRDFGAVPLLYSSSRHAQSILLEKRSFPMYFQIFLNISDRIARAKMNIFPILDENR